MMSAMITRKTYTPTAIITIAPVDNAAPSTVDTWASVGWNKQQYD